MPDTQQNSLKPNTLERPAPTVASTPSPEEVLRERFQLEEFRLGQRAVIDALLAGRPALAVFPTGGGKSLCYQLPALLLEGLTLVVSPLIALMKDQVDALQKLGIEAARLDSSLSSDEARAIYQAVGEGRLKLLYVAPERLVNEGFLNRLRRTQISLLAIDEAHCISEWGHNFRPDYLKLAGFAQEFAVERVLALTATATPAVAADVREAFGIVEADHIQTGFRRPNLALHVTASPVRERVALLCDRLRQHEGPSVVYVTLQRTAVEVSEALAQAGFSARCYHAGLKTEVRTEVQEAFMAGSCRVVVATIAFGMGIDKSDIASIYHYNLPKTLENYSQEIGRAGRDGSPAHCEVFASLDDTITLGNFTYGDTPTQAAIEGVLREFLGQEERFSISRYHLARAHDLRPLVLATLLTYLELGGVLRSTGPFYSGYKFQFLRSEPEVCARFGSERARFLERVFQASKRGRTWLTLEPAEAAQELGEPRERIVKAIQYLEEQGDLTLRPSGLRHGYLRLETPSVSDLASDLAGRFAEREQRDEERLELLVSFCEEPGCLTRRLLAYFGEELAEDCGTCGRCTGTPAQTLTRTPLLDLEEAAKDSVRALVREGHASLAEPRQQARFLCGLPSPATTQAKLRSHPRFGALAGASFPRVLELTRALAAE
ncbi:MAG: RecQ family ATP-dependent DNA helicase [Planctomycetes bacterium]|nr:RecQ family ATP-dependent DNA helicase [Planctomycetota bacterium]